MGGHLLTFRSPRAAGRRATGLVVVVALGLAAGSCGSTTSATGGGGPSGASGPSLDYGHVPQPAGANPSKSARMICTSEVQTELAYALGVKPVAPVRPSWVNHVYACKYVYRNGVLALSVTEMSSQAETTGTFDSDKQRLGDTAPVTGLGQGGFVTNDGSVVVRKDFKVLFVDVSGLPARFGSPPTSAGDVAITVADVVMACWNGD